MTTLLPHVKVEKLEPKVKIKGEKSVQKYEPPPRHFRPYTELDKAFHELVKLVARAYYGDPECVVIDALLYLDHITNHRVREEELAKELSLPLKLVREYLQKFKNEGLIHGDEKLDERKDNGVRKRTYRGSRRHMHFSWFFKIDHFTKVISYKHSMILSSLTKKVDKAAQYYSCPNPTCPLQGRRWSIMELLQDGNHEFRCSFCKLPDSNGDLKGMTMKLTSESADELGGARERTMKKFNQQVDRIVKKWKEVNELLKIEIEKEEARKKAERLASQRAPDPIVGIGAPPLKSENLKGDGKSAADKKKKIAALPWEAGAASSLPPLESETKIAEAEKQKKEEEEKKKKQEEDKKELERRYHQELMRQLEIYKNQSVSQQEQEVKEPAPQAEEMAFYVEGKPYPLSELSQELIEKMSPQEFEEYERVMEQHQSSEV